jgi:sporulation protein YlmC with PRC-barrel domain
MTPSVLSASTLEGDDVVNAAGTKLGTLKELMIDITSGELSYVVLSRGGLMGMGERLYAIPWGLVSIDGDNQQILLDLDEEFLDRSPGFDPDNWPEFSSQTWGEDLHRHYGVEPYWGGRGGEAAPPLT